MTRGPELLRGYAERTRRKQNELAEYLELTDAHLSQILSRKRSPGLATAVRIEDKTGVPIRSWVDTPVGKVAPRMLGRARKQHIAEELIGG